MKRMLMLIVLLAGCDSSDSYSLYGLEVSVSGADSKPLAGATVSVYSDKTFKHPMASVKSFDSGPLMMYFETRPVGVVAVHPTAGRDAMQIRHCGGTESVSLKLMPSQGMEGRPFPCACN